MARVDLVKAIQNSAAPGAPAVEPAAAFALEDAPSPPLPTPEAGPRPRARGWLYAVMDRGRRFFQAPAIQQTQSLMHHIDILAGELRQMNGELSALSRKVDAVILRTEHRP